MSYGVFRHYPRAKTKRKFLPSKTAAVTASYLVKPRIDLGHDQYDHTLYTRQFIIPARSRNLVFNERQRLNQERSDFRQKKAFIFSNTATPSLSIVFKKKRNIFQADEPIRNIKNPIIWTARNSLIYKTNKPRMYDSYDYFALKKTILSKTLVVTPSLLFIPPRRIEQDIIKGIEENLHHHYKPKEYYEIIGTVTPPPGIGSLVFKAKTRHWLVDDESYQYILRELTQYLSSASISSAPDKRTVMIEAQDRISIIEGQDRIVIIEKQSRNINVE